MAIVKGGLAWNTPTEDILDTIAHHLKIVEHYARAGQSSAPPYVKQHLREVQLSAQLTQVQLEYTKLALEGGR